MGTYRFLARTAERDRNGWRSNPYGWQLDAYNQNPVVLFNHNVNDFPIGSAMAFLRAELMYADVTFAQTARGQEAEDLVTQGHLRGISASARPLAPPLMERDGSGRTIGFYTPAQELTHLSLVNVPAASDTLFKPDELEASIAAGTALLFYGDPVPFGAGAMPQWEATLAAALKIELSGVLQ